MLWIESFRCFLRNWRPLLMIAVCAWAAHRLAIFLLLKFTEVTEVIHIVSFIFFSIVFWLSLILLIESEPISTVTKLSAVKWRSSLGEILHIALLAVPLLVIGTVLLNAFFILGTFGLFPDSNTLATTLIKTAQLLGILFYFGGFSYAVFSAAQCLILLMNSKSAAERQNLNRGKWWRLIGNYVLLSIILELFVYLGGAVQYTHILLNVPFAQFLMSAYFSALHILQLCILAAFTLRATSIFYKAKRMA